MKKTLNILTIIYGSLLLLSGILKCFGALDVVKLNLGNMTLTINNPINTPYILLFNFVGGGSLVFFASKTLRYHKYLPIVKGTLDEEQKAVHNSQVLSGLTLFTGFYSAFVSLWILFRGISMLSIFENNVLDYMPLLIFVVAYYIPFGIIPIMVVFVNLSTHNEIKKRNETIAFHAKKQKKKVD